MYSNGKVPIKHGAAAEFSTNLTADYVGT